MRHGINLKAGAIERCTSQGRANQVLACIERRMLDARMIGWRALEQSWQRDFALARDAMKQKGWT